jgi:hypothetical protein
MAIRILSEPPADRSSFVTLTKGMSGHFAVIYWWAPEHGGFWEPLQSGIGRYATQAEADVEAREIADAEAIGYLPPKGVSAQ